MDPLAALAIIDASITTYARAMALLQTMREQGLITVEQQNARVGDVAISRALAGLPPVASDPQPDPGQTPG